MSENDETAPHLTPEVTDRGFKHMPPLADSFESNAVRVLEASTATEPCIWLRLQDPPVDGHAVAHLTAAAAWQLKEQIEWLLEHHYQGDARP